MVSKRVKYALAHLSRKKHLAILARPVRRRLTKTDIHCTADPFAVHRAALKCHPSRRLGIMAQPRVVNKKFDPTKQGSGYPRVHPKTLNAKSSKRIVELSLPKRRAKINKKLHKALSKPEDWTRHKQTLERIAAPKVSPEPWSPDRGEKKSLEEMKERLDILALPVVKDFGEQRDPFSVRPSALKYQASERIKEIATRKIIREAFPPKDPTAVSPAAVKAVPTPRVLILAKPAVRPPGLETDLKEDAFSVVPRALKAKCSARTKILAKPKSYGNST